MTRYHRKGSYWFLLIILVGLAGVASTALRLDMALNDPDTGLALEAFDKPSRLSYLRGLLYLKAGGDANKPIALWDYAQPPLVACVDSGNHALARALVTASNASTWRTAVKKACAAPSGSADPMIAVLAQARGIDPDALCVGSANEGAPSG